MAPPTHKNSPSGTPAFPPSGIAQNADDPSTCRWAWKIPQFWVSFFLTSR